MPQVYESIPSQIEAMQLTGDEKNFRALQFWMNGEVGEPASMSRDSTSTKCLAWNEGGDTFIYVAANEAWLQIERFEWVAKDELGFYPIKDEVFRRKYRPV